MPRGDVLVEGEKRTLVDAGEDPFSSELIHVQEENAVPTFYTSKLK